MEDTFFDSELDAEDYIDEASKQALKKHDRGYYASGERKRPGYDKEGKKIKKRKKHATPKHKSTSSEKRHKAKLAKKRDKKRGG